MTEIEQTTTVNVADVKVEVGDWGSQDFRGSIGAWTDPDAYILQRLTFHSGGVTFSMRGRWNEIVGLIEKISKLLEPPKDLGQDPTGQASSDHVESTVTQERGNEAD